MGGPALLAAIPHGKQGGVVPGPQRLHGSTLMDQQAMGDGRRAYSRCPGLEMTREHNLMFLLNSSSFVKLANRQKYSSDYDPFV